jgi:hypothetical protein
MAVGAALISFPDRLSCFRPTAGWNLVVWRWIVDVMMHTSTGLDLSSYTPSFRMHLVSPFFADALRWNFCLGLQACFPSKPAILLDSYPSLKVLLVHFEALERWNVSCLVLAFSCVVATLTLVVGTGAVVVKSIGGSNSLAPFALG